MEKKTKRHILSALFADNLNALRSERGLSIKRGAAELGVARSTWCQWEKGKRFPSGFFLGLLAEYFDVPPCRFLALQPDDCFPANGNNKNAGQNPDDCCSRSVNY